MATDKKANVAYIMFACDPALKSALHVWAAKQDRAAAECARQAVADLVGYKLGPLSGKMGRKNRYATKEDAKAAAKARDKAKRELVRELLKKHAEEQALEVAN